MKLTPKQYEEIVSRPAIKRANQDCGQAQGSQPQRLLCNEPLEAPQGEAGHPGRYAVSIVSFRTRLIDPDNLCPKYFIDGLRYAGLLPDDRPEIINLQVTQEKVTSKAEIRTEITIVSI